jgi:hypothetical protein
VGFKAVGRIASVSATPDPKLQFNQVQTDREENTSQSVCNRSGTQTLN